MKWKFPKGEKRNWLLLKWNIALVLASGSSLGSYHIPMRQNFDPIWCELSQAITSPLSKRPPPVRDDDDNKDNNDDNGYNDFPLSISRRINFS